jgi:short-subunit dehydrogenase
VSGSDPGSLAVVTGASNGIGYQLAAELARRGFDLLVTGRSQAIQATAAERTRLGGATTAVQADLSDYEGVEKLWQAITDLQQPVEVAEVHAGAGLGGAFRDDTLDDELHLISFNVASVVHLTKHLTDAMTARGRGRLLITSSTAAAAPTPYETVYGPSRAFTRNFALGLREELRGSGVTVTVFSPGATNSDFHARAGMKDTAFGPGEGKNDTAEVARQGIEALLAGRAEIIAGDRASKRIALINRLLPETLKAARHARMTKPGNGQQTPTN